VLIEFVRGFCAPYRSLKLLRRREIWPYFLGPVLISSCLLIVGLIYFVSQIDSLLGTYLLDWAGCFASIIWWILAIAMSSVLFVLITLVAIPVASPFNDSLCSAILSTGGKNSSKSSSTFSWIRLFPAVIYNEFRKIRYIALLSLPLMVLTITPVINGLSPFTWFVFSLWVLAFEYLDYPLSYKCARSPQTLKIMRENRSFSFGFGLGMFFISIVPVLNIFALPTGVLAASFSYEKGYFGDN